MRLQKDRLYVAFEVVHRDERFVQRLRQCFRISDSYKERSDPARTLGYANRVEIRQSSSGLL